MVHARIIVLQVVVVVLEVVILVVVEQRVLWHVVMVHVQLLCVVGMVVERGDHVVVERGTIVCFVD